ncbi:MAG: hypothetical protein Q4G49_15300, partial [Paracoccus sp. (in: a-proteobacteria)]|nr:hypothetical protein [Paracoccus sp. (in: a-proteobacteria)]
MLNAQGRPVAAPVKLLTQDCDGVNSWQFEMQQRGGGFWMRVHVNHVGTRRDGFSSIHSYDVQARIFDSAGHQIGGTFDLLDRGCEDISGLEIAPLPHGMFMLSCSWVGIIEQDVWIKVIGDGTGNMPRIMQAQAGKPLEGGAGR